MSAVTPVVGTVAIVPPPVELPGGEVIKKLYNFATAIWRASVEHAHPITLENAFEHPNIVAVKDSFVELVGAADTTSALIAAAKALRQAFEATPHTGDDNILRRGQLAGAAISLAELAAMEASKPLQVFIYTIKQVIPWLEGLFKLGVLVVSAVV